MQLPQLQPPPQLPLTIHRPVQLLAATAAAVATAAPEIIRIP